MMNEETKTDSVARISPAQIIPIIPRNYEEVFKMGTLMAKTNMVPKDFKGQPENTIVAIQMGLEVGLLPMQALQNIAVINGRPCIWGDAQLALVRGSGHMEWMKESGDMEYATCEVKRFGDPNPVSQTFRKTDAQRAGLWEKVGPWKQYPKRMLQMRARGFALRDLFPDVLKGIQSREEVQDIIDIESVTIKEVKKVDITESKKKLDAEKSNLDILKDEGKKNPPPTPGIADENANPPPMTDDLPFDDPPPEVKETVLEFIDEKEFSQFIEEAKRLKIPTKKLAEFAKKNGFSDISKITKEKFKPMFQGLSHLTK